MRARLEWAALTLRFFRRDYQAELARDNALDFDDLLLRG